MVIRPNKGLRNVHEWMDGWMDVRRTTNTKIQQYIIKSRSSGVVLKTDGCFHPKDLLLLCLTPSTTDSDTVRKCPDSHFVMPRLPVFFFFFLFLLVCFQQQNENTALSRKQDKLNAAPRDSIVHFIAFCKDEWKQQPWIPEHRRSIPAPVQFF